MACAAVSCPDSAGRGPAGLARRAARGTYQGSRERRMVLSEHRRSEPAQPGGSGGEHDHHGHPEGRPPRGPAEPGYPEHPEQGGPAGGRHAGHDTHAGHDKHAGHSVAMFRDKFWISLALTVPTLVWGHMLPRALGYAPPDVPGHRWIAPVFGTAVFLYGGLVFLRGAWRELSDRLPGMMTLIGIAISV